MAPVKTKLAGGRKWQPSQSVKILLNLWMIPPLLIRSIRVIRKQKMAGVRRLRERRLMPVVAFQFCMLTARRG
jgi:hypothetical protein